MLEHLGTAAFPCHMRRKICIQTEKKMVSYLRKLNVFMRQLVPVM